MERSKSNIFIAVELKKEKKMVGHIYFNRTEPKEKTGHDQRRKIQEKCLLQEK